MVYFSIIIYSLGFEAQLETCQEYIESKDGLNIGVFQDIGTGSSRTRVGLLAALELCKKENATLVLAKLDRLSHDQWFGHSIKESGVKLYFCDFPDINNLTFGILLSVAQHERELGKQRTKAALDVIQKKLDRGETHISKAGNLITSLGNPNFAEVQKLGNQANARKSKEAKLNDPERQRARKMALEMWNRGCSQKEIVNYLNEVAQVRTRSGGLWGQPQVSYLINFG